MAQVTIPLSTDLQRYVDGRVSAEGFADSAAYVRDLIERDQDMHQSEVRRVRALVEAGIASGIVDREPEDVLDDVVQDVLDGDG